MVPITSHAPKDLSEWIAPFIAWNLSSWMAPTKPDGKLLMVLKSGYIIHDSNKRCLSTTLAQKKKKLSAPASETSWMNQRGLKIIVILTVNTTSWMVAYELEANRTHAVVPSHFVKAIDRWESQVKTILGCW